MYRHVYGQIDIDRHKYGDIDIDIETDRHKYGDVLSTTSTCAVGGWVGDRERMVVVRVHARVYMCT
jgi:hypothetical protein